MIRIHPGAILMFLCQVKDYVRDGMKEAFDKYDETKFKDALDTVQKEVIF